MNTKINVTLLLRVADVISKHPEQFDMGKWECGTTACLAGWSLRLIGKRIGQVPWSVAIELLGLSRSQTEEIFWESDWPFQFQFSGSDTDADRAAKAVKRIHTFLDEHASGWREEHKL